MLKDNLNLGKKKKIKINTEESPYETIKMIGYGTFGKVYQVLNKKDNKIYALKEVLQDHRFKNRQLSIISLLSHPNIISMLDYHFKIINQDCYLNILMDFMDMSLSTLIKEHRKARKSLEKTTRKIIAFQMFKGLYYLSLNKVCHRDLKPPNILINTSNLEVKICDFGSAKIIQKNQNNVSYICSRYYRAPQLILSSTSYGTEIDMWSAGCVLVQFLTCEPIFPGDSSLEQLIEIIKIIGTPPEATMKRCQKQLGIELNLPEIKPNDWSKILRKYDCQPSLLDLIKNILTYNTESRLKPHEVLMHEYFHDLVLEEEHLEKLPNLLDFSQLETKRNKKIIQGLKKQYDVNLIEHYDVNALKLKEINEMENSTVETSPNAEHFKMMKKFL